MNVISARSTELEALKANLDAKTKELDEVKGQLDKQTLVNEDLKAKLSKANIFIYSLFGLAVAAIVLNLPQARQLLPKPYFSGDSCLVSARDDGNGLAQTLQQSEWPAQPNSVHFTTRSGDTYRRLGPYLGQEDELTLVWRHESLDDCEYTGQVNPRHQRHGYGRCVYSNGVIYEGYWKEGKRNGKGRQIEADGSVYIGDFLKDKRVGLGTKDYADGSSYTGAWVNDDKQGIGSMKSGDSSGFPGEESFGEWLKAKLHGRGAYFHRDGSMFVGNFKLYKKHGKGVMWNPKEVCFGDWEQGQLSGIGTCLYTNGTVYTGEWVKGVQSGQGTFTHPGAAQAGVWASIKSLI